MAGDGWRHIRLGDLVSIKHGFAFKGEYFTEEERTDILLTPGNFAIGGGFQDKKFKYYQGPVPDEFVLKAGDLLVTMTDLSKDGDTLGYPAIVPKDLRYRYLHNQRLGLVEIQDNVALDKRFLFYRLCAGDYRHHVLATASGSTVKHTSPSRIYDFEFELPSIAEQRAIAAILMALDDKIDLNRRMNRTLEAMVRAIFKSWFVDFDPVRAKGEGRDSGLPRSIADLFPDHFQASELGEIPKGWRIGSVYEVSEVIYGAPFASEFFNSERQGMSLLRIRDLATHQPEVFTSEQHPKATVVKPGDIVVGMDGEFRVHHWRGESALLNQRVCTFRPKPGIPRCFVSGSIFEPMAFFERSKVGTTVIHLGKADIDTIEIVLPSNAVLNTFSQATEPLLDRILCNEIEMRALTAIRDTMLPKLISGEVRVKDTETIIGRIV